MIEEIERLLISLTGFTSENFIHPPREKLEHFSFNSGLGYSQLNELLLLFGCKRVSREFFQFLVDGNIKYSHGSKICSLTHFREGIENFQRVALLFYGNIGFAFKELSRDYNKLVFYLSLTSKKDINEFRNRHNPVVSTKKIDAEKTFFLGHLIKKEIEDKLANPEDKAAIQLEEERKKYFEIGRGNFDAYLTYDHMDVYVATSMREKHEYYLVNKLTEEIFNHRILEDLKLRWFDPTQATCKSRIDKGLAEALMLKRAKCTLYLVQESDTLGKDSELASTLAQGKPVIAYVPIGDRGYFNKLIDCFRLLYKDLTEKKLLLFLYRIINPALAWENEKIIDILSKNTEKDISTLNELVSKELEKHYNKRAKTLSNEHPLGIQVDLSSGVANGLLVVRTVDDCAKLIRAIVDGSLDFDIEYDNKEGKNDILLIEKISRCIFRIVTGDRLLTNSFWNFYLLPENNTHGNNK